MSEQNLTPDNAEDTEGHYLRPMSQPTDPKKDSYRVAFEKLKEFREVMMSKDRSRATRKYRRRGVTHQSRRDL